MGVRAHAARTETALRGWACVVNAREDLAAGRKPPARRSINHAEHLQLLSTDC